MITIAITIILARLLEPEDFGLIGMITVFIMVANVVVDGGFVAALIYKKKASQEDFSTVFYTSLVVSIVLFAILFLCSTPIAEFYGQASLKILLRWLSVSPILGSLSIVHYALYSREMDFKTIAKVGLMSQIVSGIIAITIAWFGGKVWALVFQNLVMGFLVAVFFWAMNSWRPQKRISLKSLKSLSGYGINLMMTSMLHQIFENIHYVIIGKFYNPMQLGYYVQANKTQRIPAIKIQEVIKKATFPEFVRIADDRTKFRKYFSTLSKNTLAINFPVMICLALLSNDLVLLLFTEKWIKMVPYMELLCMASLFFPFYALCSNTILAKGNSLLNFKVEVLKKVCVATSIIVSIQWGIIGLIVGQIIASVVFVFIHLFFVERTAQIKVLQTLLPIMQYLVVAFAPFVIIKIVLSKYSFGPLFNVLVYGTIYFLIYTGLVYILNRNEPRKLKKLLKYKL